MGDAQARRWRVPDLARVWGRRSLGCRTSGLPKYRSDAAEATTKQASDEVWRLEHDSRERWLTTFAWVSDRYLDGLVPRARWFDTLEALNDLSTTKEQTELLATAIEMEPRRSDGTA